MSMSMSTTCSLDCTPESLMVPLQVQQLIIPSSQLSCLPVVKIHMSPSIGKPQPPAFLALRLYNRYVPKYAKKNTPTAVRQSAHVACRYDVFCARCAEQNVASNQHHVPITKNKQHCMMFENHANIYIYIYIHTYIYMYI